MPQTLNELGQPIGFAVDDWRPAGPPSREPMIGRTCRVEVLDPARHAEELHAANMQDTQHRIWTYLAYGPFESLGDYRKWAEEVSASDDPLFYAIIAAASEKAVGVASYLRITPASGTIEVGHINYSPALQGTIAATEAMYLMMKRVFESGYRRYEWKCDALNARSRAAAQRLGFSYEGIFRQATIYKGRNRDTAWYAMIDREWPELEEAFTRWLDPGNFDNEGRQRLRLSDLTRPILKACG
ncbi:MAG: GNAT family N-acetyltransferase [Gammaproteobacteria bacterium]|nr:GNAT family N-acetyltransferase [Gammaproteobacteria bacterium]NIM74120.1 GNAT family N-acetyltransferase [Gammaproteobacteria bacterium]NIN39003.1 GNAT family N-acetyltransferase [Gammaproteobacteria bacterium]NIO25896.1 GNAT family N-acetyltransferase [Gammaproteobacteria bacterium]NIO66527.1 GNAT family N-acetyltransferase [Gammaproteobacteria bacterium]